VVERSIEISCRHVWRELSSFIDGEVDTALRERMRRHFEQCTHCRAILDGTSNVIELVGDDRSFALPQGFSERLRRRLTPLQGKSGS
jgi:anti-sigma factor (TIGR02949 family)